MNDAKLFESMRQRMFVHERSWIHFQCADPRYFGFEMLVISITFHELQLSVGRKTAILHWEQIFECHITAPWPFSLLSKHTYWVLTIHLAGHISRQTSCWYRIAMENQHIVLDPLMVRIMSGKLWFKSATQLPSSSKVRLSSLRGIGWIWFCLRTLNP